MSKGMRWDRVRTENNMRSRGHEDVMGRGDHANTRIVNRLEPKPAKPKKPPPFRREPPDACLVSEHAFCLHMTQKALLVVHGGKQEWFPRRIVHPSSKVKTKNDRGRFVVLKRWVDRPPPDKLCSDPS